MDNITLIEQSRHGDRDAFARIVTRYQGMVSAATLNVVGNYAQSEDLAQETFLTAWKKLPELREPEKLGSWLYGIARRIALRWVESQQRSPLHHATELNAEMMSDQQAQTAEAERQQREQSLELVWSTVKELPETLREPLLLYYRYSKSAADIAASLDLTEEAVHQRLSRGRKMLKAEVEKQVETVLETTRPDTAFTLAVLASLPLAAATTGCSVAGMGTAAGNSSGWFWWTPLLCIFAPIILITGGFMGLWTALKHSPTVRTRRFMCRTALQWLVFLGLFVMLLDRQHHQWNVHYGALFYGYFVIIVVFCSWLVYRWRILLEEDAGLLPPPDKPLEKTSLSLFWLRCWYWLPLLPIVVICLLTSIELYIELRYYVLEDSYVLDGTLSFSPWKEIVALAGCSLGTLIPISFFLIIAYGIQTSRDENSLRRWYPRNEKVFLPKPEEKTRWQSFLFDLAVMYCSTFVPMIPMFVSYEIANSPLFWIFFPTMMMTIVTLIASHSAGIPGKRLRGYAQLFLFVGLFYAIMFSLGRSSYVFESDLSIKGILWRIIFVLIYFGAALLAFVMSRRRVE